MQKAIVIACLSMGLCIQAHAIAPVVDDSDNFSNLEDKPLTAAPSEAAIVAKADENTPLAREMPEDKSQSGPLSDQLHALQQEVQTLRGELEVQAHTIEQLKLEATRFYKDLDARLRTPGDNKTMPLAPAEAVKVQKPIPHTPPTSDNPADEQIRYLSAYDLVKSKHYDEALLAMKAFVTQYPDGGYAANAEYWMGELYLAKHSPQEAIPHFEKVLQKFPTSSKAAASALKIAYAMAALGRKEEARARLKEVIKNYPDTAASQLAKAKLDTL